MVYFFAVKIFYKKQRSLNCLNFYGCTLVHMESKASATMNSFFELKSIKEFFKGQVPDVLKRCKRSRIFDVHPSMLRGRLTSSEVEIFEKLVIFLSSTFEDTKFEQDFLLAEIFPFLRKICLLLDIDFDIVSMRWGVNGKAGDSHKTGELCMQQLEYCKKTSISTAYITFQGETLFFPF